MSVRGIRGATTAASNTSEDIIAATSRLLGDMVAANHVCTDDIVAVFFTTTPDLNAEFPAAAARALGWRKVPLLCSSEIDVPGRVQSCVRVLMLVNADVAQAQITHVYLEGARRLRPDLSGEHPETAGTTF
ncbi:MAG: chorismate mutase [Candidatus Eremiobacteraeota bacterium]|nr:chorismate mutase [Candidatus Eremiobacteraeota bacterium]MBV8204597.1 chorismate mutase [Candidatus Eremiobacteraeota bacterium]